MLDNHVDATTALAERARRGERRPDLVIWPENSTDIDPFATRGRADIERGATRSASRSWSAR